MKLFFAFSLVVSTAQILYAQAWKLYPIYYKHGIYACGDSSYRYTRYWAAEEGGLCAPGFASPPQLGQVFSLMPAQDTASVGYRLGQKLLRSPKPSETVENPMFAEAKRIGISYQHLYKKQSGIDSLYCQLCHNGRRRRAGASCSVPAGSGELINEIERSCIFNSLFPALGDSSAYVLKRDAGFGFYSPSGQKLVGYFNVYRCDYSRKQGLRFYSYLVSWADTAGPRIVRADSCQLDKACPGKPICKWFKEDLPRLSASQGTRCNPVSTDQMVIGRKRFHVSLEEEAQINAKGNENMSMAYLLIQRFDWINKRCIFGER